MQKSENTVQNLDFGAFFCNQIHGYRIGQNTNDPTDLRFVFARWKGQRAMGQILTMIMFMVGRRDIVIVLSNASRVGYSATTLPNLTSVPNSSTPSLLQIVSKKRSFVQKDC